MFCLVTVYRGNGVSGVVAATIFDKTASRRSVPRSRVKPPPSISRGKRRMCVRGGQGRGERREMGEGNGSKKRGRRRRRRRKRGGGEEGREGKRIRNNKRREEVGEEVIITETLYRKGPMRANK